MLQINRNCLQAFCVRSDRRRIEILHVFWKHSYKGCSESSASYFMMSASDLRGERWWDGSRDWTFLPLSHYISLLCDRWQQRGSPTERRLLWERLWSKGDVTEFLHAGKKMAAMGIPWRLLNGYGGLTVDVSPVRWRCEYKPGSGRPSRFVRGWQAGSCSGKKAQLMVAPMLTNGVL